MNCEVLLAVFQWYCHKYCLHMYSAVVLYMSMQISRKHAVYSAFVVIETSAFVWECCFTKFSEHVLKEYENFWDIFENDRKKWHSFMYAPVTHGTLSDCFKLGCCAITLHLSNPFFACMVDIQVFFTGFIAIQGSKVFISCL